MNAYPRNRFAKGSACFACTVCDQNTRCTGDNGPLEMCPTCREIADYQNSLSDEGIAAALDVCPWDDSLFEGCGTPAEVRTRYSEMRNKAKAIDSTL